MDTVGSVIDIVFKMKSTFWGNGILFGSNDDDFFDSGDSCFSFQAKSGTAYYVAIGGYDDGTAVEFGNAAIGSPYFIPVTTTLTVTSDTPDTTAPAVAAFSTSPALTSQSQKAARIGSELIKISIFILAMSIWS